mmetsp:Transcript_26852/g.74975  ORF Transcript_26852/g.74975 Transcript_26852/m.74975 type:complete len:209 (-) Transcript_26852:2325-2951(-)
MMVDKIAPLEPMSAPTMVSRLLERTKPSAVSAQPEALFSSVITTGMSAPPTWAVTSQPRSPAPPMLASRRCLPAAGLATNLTRPTPTATTRAAFTLFWNLKRMGRPDMMPWSFEKAMMLPVMVIAPITAAAYVERLCRTETSCDAKKDARAVAVAATPTRLWNAATSWGREVTSTRLAMPAPIPPPMAMVPKTCVRTGCGTLSDNSVP